MKDTSPNDVRGVILELFFNIGATEAAISHEYENLVHIEDTIRQLKELDVPKDELKDELEKQEEAKQNIRTIIEILTTTRRKKQALLEKYAIDLDLNHHCTLKHLSRVFEQNLEAYVSTGFSPEFEELIHEDSQALALVLKRYLGLEYGDCFRCISDYLKEKIK